MPDRIMAVRDVATTLGIDQRSVERLAEAGDLRGRKSDGRWVFRRADVSNWMAENLGAMRTEAIAPGKTPAADLIIREALKPETVAVPLHATSRASVLRELVQLVGKSGHIEDPRGLLASLEERERQCPTAFPGGVAIPHPAKIGQFSGEYPVIAACKLHHGIPFGDRAGTLTDLFFLVCCANYRQHLMHLGRLCRILSRRNILSSLREAPNPDGFVQVLDQEEAKLCGHLC